MHRFVKYALVGIAALLVFYVALVAIRVATAQPVYATQSTDGGEIIVVEQDIPLWAYANPRSILRPQYEIETTYIINNYNMKPVDRSLVNNGYANGKPVRIVAPTARPQTRANTRNAAPLTVPSRATPLPTIGRRATTVPPGQQRSLLTMPTVQAQQAAKPTPATGVTQRLVQPTPATGVTRPLAAPTTRPAQRQAAPAAPKVEQPKTQPRVAPAAPAPRQRVCRTDSKGRTTCS